MANLDIPAKQREFLCEHCRGKIAVPQDLPPTTGPCPYCSGTITSPASDVPPPSAVNSEPPLTVGKTKESHPRVEIPTRSPAVVAAEVAGNVKPKERAASSGSKGNRSSLVSWMLGALALILLGGGGAYFVSTKLGRNTDPPMAMPIRNDAAAREASYLRNGWQKDAARLLHDYLAAKSTAEKLPFILRGGELGKKIEDFYRSGINDDADIPAESFSINELTEDDRKRGIFMMIYRQPSTGDTAHEPVRVQAFFKRTPEGLKLDWEMFAQTKYRTLRKFVGRPEIGQTGVFRVLMVEAMPDKSPSSAATRVYRIIDPAHPIDLARVNVKVDSDAGRALSLVQWSGGEGHSPLTRTATLELRWSGQPGIPELEISRLVCWEFLGLGGEETPATPSTK